MISFPPDAPRISLVEARIITRPAPLRMPFGFGVAVLRSVEQAVLLVRITDTDGRTASGLAAECLLPKWFDKAPELSDADNIAQLRRSLDMAIEFYRDIRHATAFGLSAPQKLWMPYLKAARRQIIDFVYIRAPRLRAARQLP